MFMEHADGCSEHNKYQMKWVVLFLSTYLVCPPFAAITAAHLSDIVSVQVHLNKLERRGKVHLFQ